MTSGRIDLSLPESRYDRQERISWWDQDRLSNARVLVVGAGALGNEIVKNLALVGIGYLCVVDMDVVENANLSRCVFFSESDAGHSKAAALTQGARELNPELEADSRTVAVQELGIGFLLGFDLVIAGLDNREARRWINQGTRKLGLTWIDGAIEGLQGLVRTFPPEGACYECTLGEADLRALEHRRSCALLSAQEMLSGKVPTNATTASIVAGVQAQEAIKLLVGKPELSALANKAWVLSGETMLTYTVDYIEDPYCPAHDTYEIVEPPCRRIETLAELLEGGPDPDAIDLEDDLVTLADCDCGNPGRTQFRTSLPPGSGVCDVCDAPRRITSRTSLAPGDELVKHRWRSFHAPEMDIVTLRSGDRREHIVVARQGDSS